MIEILSSPVFWSSGTALLGVILGIKLYIAKIIREDKAIEEQRREKDAN